MQCRVENVRAGYRARPFATGRCADAQADEPFGHPAAGTGWADRWTAVVAGPDDDWAPTRSVGRAAFGVCARRFCFAAAPLADGDRPNGRRDRPTTVCQRVNACAFGRGSGDYDHLSYQWKGVACRSGCAACAPAPFARARRCAARPRIASARRRDVGGGGLCRDGGAVCAALWKTAYASTVTNQPAGDAAWTPRPRPVRQWCRPGCRRRDCIRHR